MDNVFLQFNCVPPTYVPHSYIVVYACEVG